VTDDAPGELSPTEAAREEFLRQMLEAFERGAIDATDYAARVDALEAAGSVADMVAIAAGGPAAPVVVPAPAAVPRGGSPTTAPAKGGLDPVDLARLTSPPRTASRRDTQSRYTALVVVILLFVVLLVAGLIMASHVHPSGGTVVPGWARAGARGLRPPPG